MPAISVLKFVNGNWMPSFSSLSSATASDVGLTNVGPLFFAKCRWCPQALAAVRRETRVFSKSSEAEGSSGEDEWLQKLPDKKKPLYSHSLPCIESWLKSLGFCQSREDRAVWLIEKPDWHAQLSLDITDLYIRYLKGGPGNLEKDMERRFSYALSREDIENAILGGP